MNEPFKYTISKVSYREISSILMDSTDIILWDDVREACKKLSSVEATVYSLREAVWCGVDDILEGI
jgi:hypothetical protein